MCGVPFQVLGQIDNIDSLEGTLFHADTTSDTKWFGEVGNFRLGTDFDTEFAKFNDWAGLFTFLVTLFGLASLWCDDGNTCQSLFVSGGVVFLYLLFRRHLEIYY